MADQPGFTLKSVESLGPPLALLPGLPLFLISVCAMERSSLLVPDGPIAAVGSGLNEDRHPVGFRSGAHAAVGIGLDAYVLVGGPDKSFAL